MLNKPGRLSKAAEKRITDKLIRRLDADKVKIKTVNNVKLTQAGKLRTFIPLTIKNKKQNNKISNNKNSRL